MGYGLRLPEYGMVILPMKTNAVRLSTAWASATSCGTTRSIPTTSPPRRSPARSACRPSRSSRRWWPVATSTASAWPSCRETAQLDLKALARATGDKKIDTVPLKEVEPLTGYCFASVEMG